MNKEMKKRLRNHDWKRTLLVGHDKAIDDLRKNAPLDDWRIAWALLRDAATVSRIAYPAPPRRGFPTSSSMPDAADDVTQWQLMSAYLQGHLTSLPDIENRPPKPTAAEVDRAAIVLDLWHHCALARKGDKSRLKKAVYLRACGVAPRKIASVTGLNPQQLRRATMEASTDIFIEIERFSK